MIFKIFKNEKDFNFSTDIINSCFYDYIPNLNFKEITNCSKFGSFDSYKRQTTDHKYNFF